MSSKYYICSNMHIVYQMVLKRVYGDCDGSSKVHNRLSCVLRMSCSLNCPQTSASCMEIATVIQWYTTDCLVHGKCHAPSMVHTRVPRVWKLPRFFNGTQPTVLRTQNIMLLKWSKNEYLVHADCHGSSMGHNRL